MMSTGLETMRKMPEKPASMTGPTIERTISFERPRVSSRVWPSRGGGPAVMTTMSASPQPAYPPAVTRMLRPR